LDVVKKGITVTLYAIAIAYRRCYPHIQLGASRMSAAVTVYRWVTHTEWWVDWYARHWHRSSNSSVPTIVLIKN